MIGSKEQMSETVAGEGPLVKSSYKGGFLGHKAILEAFNGWDILKATGRSAKWLFKGRKTRHTDASYNLNRKNTDDSDFGAQGQKLGTMDNQTAYTGGATTLPPYASFEGEENANLLANSQSMPVSHPPTFQTEEHYGSNNASDIGLATSNYDDKHNRRYDPSPNRHPFAPYSGSTGGQETGVTALPYPDSHSGEQSSSHLGGQDSSRLYMPPPRSPDPTTRNGPDGRSEGGFF